MLIESAFHDLSILGLPKHNFSDIDQNTTGRYGCRRWVDDVSEDVGELLEQSWVSELVGLHLDFALGLEQDQFDALLGLFEQHQAKLQNLRALHLDAFDSEGLDITRVFELLPNVVHWFIEGEGIECGVCRHHQMKELIYVYGPPNNLLSYGSFPSLEYLCFDQVNQDVVSVFANAGLHKLRHLGIKAFEGDHTPLLEALPWPSSITSVQVGFLDEGSAAAMFRGLGNASLKQLSCSSITDSGVATLLNENAPDLCSLTLADSNDVPSWVENLQLPALRTLDLHNCQIDNDALSALLMIPWLEQLDRLVLSDNNFDVEALDHEATTRFTTMRAKIDY